MAKIKITETNGASAKDISDAIGRFLEQQGKNKQAQKETKSKDKKD